MALSSMCWPIGLMVVVALVSIGLSRSPVSAQQASARTASAEAPFLAENDAAMDKMMKGMTLKPSGDVDRDFVGMMVPHHQGAIDMAQCRVAAWMDNSASRSLYCLLE
jgi:uncharacterized protein (DUF305 family)